MGRDPYVRLDETLYYPCTSMCVLLINGVNQPTYLPLTHCPLAVCVKLSNSLVGECAMFVPTLSPG